MATWRVLYRVLGTCFLPFHPVAHFKKCPQHFRAPSPSGTSTLYPTLSLSLSLFPRPKVSGCFTQIVAALGELSFWCAAPSSLCSLEVRGWRWYHPQSVYCFWCFGSFLVIRFVLFHLQLHFHLSPLLLSHTILALPFLISRILLRIVSHSVPHYLCISIPVRRQGDVSLKDAFLLPHPLPPSCLKGRIGSGIVATVCQHLL